VWSSEPLTRELTDVLGLQEQIAGLIAQNLQLKLGGTERPAKAVNPEAHRLVLEGRYFWGLRTEDGFDRAEMSFRKALELDPEFAAAPAGLALVLGTRLAYTAYLGETVLAGDAQRTLAQRALTLDSGLAEAYAALAASYFNEGREAESQREYLKGLAVNPNSALLHHWYSLTLENAGRLDEALAEITRATDLDPLSGIALITRQRMLLSAGKYAEALELRERVAGLLPDVETSIGMQAISLLKLGRLKEAAGAAQQVPANSALNRRIIVDAQAIYVLRQTGHVAEATEHAAKILPRFRPNSYQRGAVLAALGRWEEAVPFLERTPAIVRYLYYWDPIWDAWRNDPKFKQLLVKLECADQYRVAREALARLQAKPGANK
jgi:tetratricopeptide (TPR) repeat protein